MASPYAFDVVERVINLSRQFRHMDSGDNRDLSQVENQVMRTIDRNPGINPKSAAKLSRLASSNFSRALGQLVEKGYVVREADVDDKRCLRLYPTEIAAAHVADLKDRWSDFLDGSLDETEAATLAGLLTKLEDGLAERIWLR